MKRIDKYSKEQLVYNVGGNPCGYCTRKGEDDCAGESCAENVLEWFNEELDTVPRIKTINTREELAKALEDRDKHCDTVIDCFDCNYGGPFTDRLENSCILNYLSEEVEVKK